MNKDSRQVETFPVWDCHVHCYPEWVASDPGGFAAKHSESHWLQLVQAGPQGWKDCHSLIQAMDREGIEKVVLLGWYWQHPQTCRLQNDWYADYIHQFPDRLMAFAAIHPHDEDVVGELERARDWGAVGIGECLPAVQSDAGWMHPGYELIINWTMQHNWPINLHVTEPAGHNYPGRIDTSFMELIDLFEAYPQQRWICAHWGGGLPFYSLNRRVEKALRNVWFDSAASPLLYSGDVWKSICDRVGHEKVLFGSDYPLLLDPNNQIEPDWSRILKQLEASGLNSADQAAILSGNLRHLLNLRA